MIFSYDSTVILPDNTRGVPLVSCVGRQIICTDGYGNKAIGTVESVDEIQYTGVMQDISMYFAVGGSGYHDSVSRFVSTSEDTLHSVMIDDVCKVLTGKNLLEILKKSFFDPNSRGSVIRGYIYDRDIAHCAPECVYPIIMVYSGVNCRNVDNEKVLLVRVSNNWFPIVYS